MYAASGARDCLCVTDSQNVLKKCWGGGVSCCGLSTVWRLRHSCSAMLCILKYSSGSLLYWLTLKTREVLPNL